MTNDEFNEALVEFFKQLNEFLTVLLEYIEEMK